MANKKLCADRGIIAQFITIITADWSNTPHRVGGFEIRCLGKNRTTVSQIFALNAVSGATDLAVQRTIGETITLLNSFGTPRFVFERIFSSPNLYAFTEGEMAELNTVISLDEM